VGKRRHAWYWLHYGLNYLYSFCRRSMPYRAIYWLLSAVSLVTAAAITLLRYVEPNQVPRSLDGVADSLNKNRFLIAFYIIIAQSTCLLLTSFFARRIARNKAQQRGVKKILNYVVEQLFEDRETDKIYRATLFRVRWCPLLGSWLGIVERSGALFPAWKTIFSVSSQHPDRNTGIAGECWWRAQNQSGENFSLALPDASGGPDASCCDEYIELGFLDPREFRKISARATFFRATPVKVEGEVWGVLVVDSTAYGDVTPRADSIQKRVLEWAAVSLTTLVD
jgi:hypothetical protein